MSREEKNCEQQSTLISCSVHSHSCILMPLSEKPGNIKLSSCEPGCCCIKASSTEAITKSPKLCTKCGTKLTVLKPVELCEECKDETLPSPTVSEEERTPEHKSCDTPDCIHNSQGMQAFDTSDSIHNSQGVQLSGTPDCIHNSQGMQLSGTPDCIHNSQGVQLSDEDSKSCCASCTGACSSASSEIPQKPVHIDPRFKDHTPKSIAELKATITGLTGSEKSPVGNLLGCEFTDLRCEIRTSRPVCEPEDSEPSDSDRPITQGISLTMEPNDHRFCTNPNDCKHTRAPPPSPPEEPPCPPEDPPCPPEKPPCPPEEPPCPPEEPPCPCPPKEPPYPGPREEPPSPCLTPRCSSCDSSQ